LLGRNWDDPQVVAMKKLHPDLLYERAGRPFIHVPTLDKNLWFAPEEIVAKILLHLKHQANDAFEGEYRKKIQKLIITVPAATTEVQKAATIQAAKLAGFVVEKVLHEPTAAAAHLLPWDPPQGQTRNLIVIDIGGGTTDFSYLTRGERLFSVQAVDGDPHLGGTDFTESLYQEVLNRHKKWLEDRRLSFVHLDDSEEQALRADVEQKKRMLRTTGPTSPVVVLMGRGEIPLIRETFTIDQATKVYKPLLQLFQQRVEEFKTLLIEKKLDIQQASIYLVGGGSGIPEIEAIVKKTLPGKLEYIADWQNCAVSGSIIYGQRRQEFQEIIYYDIGVLVRSKEDPEVEEFSKIIPASSKFPLGERTKRFRARQLHQTAMLLDIFSRTPRTNERVALLKWKMNLISTRSTLAVVELRLSLDKNGNLQAQACEVSPGVLWGLFGEKFENCQTTATILPGDALFHPEL